LKQIAENDKGLHQSPEIYCSLGNLVLGVKHLAEWEKEVAKLIRNDQTSEPCLNQMFRLCVNNSFFTYIGYGPLIKNIQFLNKLMEDLRMNKNVDDYVDRLGEMISTIDENESKLESPMTEEERTELTNRKHTAQVQLLNEIVFLSCFSKTFHSKLQSALMDVLIGFDDSKKTEDMNILDNDMFYGLIDNEATQALINEVKRNILNVDFFRSLVYPLLPTKRTDLRS
jgi:hypothetical protein